MSVNSDFRVAILTDHGSTENSRDTVAAAVRLTCRTEPVLLDAREFLDDTGGTVRRAGGRTVLTTRSGAPVRADIVIVYDVRPELRARFSGVLDALGPGTVTGDAESWRRATDKAATVDRFRRAGIPHAETVTLGRACRPGEAEAAFERLGGDAWARPAVGLGGRDVSHVTDLRGLADARARHAAAGSDWLLSRDAGNLDADGRRHQYRVIVLGDRVLRFAEHVHLDHPDAPLNEAHGATSTTHDVRDLPAHCRDLAVAATRALGLTFGGVDLAPERGGTVFEVNLHPTLGPDERLPTVAVPYVRAHGPSIVGRPPSSTRVS